MACIPYTVKQRIELSLKYCYINTMQSHRSQCKPEKFLFAKRMRRNPTPSEARLWQRLRCKQIGLKVQRQSVGYIADFYVASKRLVIELDGSAHAGREEYDRRRDTAMRKAGFKVLRFPNEAPIDQIVTAIVAA